MQGVPSVLLYLQGVHMQGVPSILYICREYTCREYLVFSILV